MLPSNKWIWFAAGIAVGVFVVPKVRATVGA